MGKRLSSSTISGMSTSIKKTVSGASGQLKRQGISSRNISNSLYIGGDSAVRFSRYMHKYSIGAVNTISGLTTELGKTATKISGACTQFEKNSNGVVDEDAIRNLKSKLTSMSSDVSGLQREIDQALNAAKKYIHVTPVKLASVSSGYKTVINGLNRIISDMHSLDKNIGNYAGGLWDLIDAADKFLKTAKSMYTKGSGYNGTALSDYSKNNPGLDKLWDEYKKGYAKWKKWAEKKWDEFVKNARGSEKSYSGGGTLIGNGGNGGGALNKHNNSKKDLLSFDVDLNTKGGNVFGHGWAGLGATAKVKVKGKDVGSVSVSGSAVNMFNSGDVHYQAMGARFDVSFGKHSKSKGSKTVKGFTIPTFVVPMNFGGTHGRASRTSVVFGSYKKAKSAQSANNKRTKNLGKKMAKQGF